MGKDKYIDFATTCKVCKDNNLNKEILKLKGKDKVTEAKKIIDAKINIKGKEAKPEHINKYINELELGELDTILKICESKNLDERIKDECAYDVQKSIEIINAEQPKDKQVLSLDSVSKYIKKLKLSEIRIICTEEKLNKQIEECASNFKKIKETIVTALSEDKKVILEDAIKEYIEELEIEVIREICKENDLDKKIKELGNDFKKAREVINANLGDDKKISLEAVKKFIEELKGNSSGETIAEQTEGKKEGNLIGRERLKELELAEAENIQLKKEKELLTSENDKLKKENENLKQQLDGTLIDKNNLFSEIPELNEILNSCNEKLDVSINKELLSMATRFVDDKSLVRLESIIRDGSNLSSTVVQSILLAFIKQNSLYKFKTSSK